MHAGALTIDILAGVVLLHMGVAVWTGLLASRWKGRNGWRWFTAGLLTSIVAMITLAMLPRRSCAEEIEVDMALQYLDGTSLLRQALLSAV